MMVDFVPVVAVMNRKALEFWGGHKAPPELAYVEIDNRHHRRVVTWEEVMRSRRKRQRAQLDRVRHVPEPRRAYKLWVAYFDQPFMGGWQAFLDDGRGYHTWIDRDCRHVRAEAIAAFPLILPFSDDDGRHSWVPFQQWKPLFAEAHRRRTQDGRPVGVAYVWWNRYDPLEAAPLRARDLSRRVQRSLSPPRPPRAYGIPYTP